MERMERIMRLVQTLHAQPFLFLPVEFSVRRGTKLSVRDFPIEGQFPVTI
jgi:predicted metalloprotease